MKGKLKMKKQKNTFKAVLLVLGSLAFLPQMQAISPPPDGCYPNFTTAEGGESGAHAQFMVFFAGISLCLTNSVRLVSFGKYEGGIHGCADCSAGTDHRR
jgi:hypothetical protein